MKKELIVELLQKFEEACYLYHNIECWSARELQVILDYNKWENFLKVIDKAKLSCENSGAKIPDHFPDIRKMIDLAKGAQRQVVDYALTRYACYLIAQNGDSSKNEIAFAQTYFAVQTRKQEIIEQRLIDIARVTAREKLSNSEKKLSGIIYERGVDDKGFAIIRSKGDHALFGGFTTNDLKGEQQITIEHVTNNSTVRKMLLKRGVKPEKLPPHEDIKKVQRKLEGDEKKMLKEIKKNKREKD